MSLSFRGSVKKTWKTTTKKYGLLSTTQRRNGPNEKTSLLYNDSQQNSNLFYKTGILRTTLNNNYIKQKIIKVIIQEY